MGWSFLATVMMIHQGKIKKRRRRIRSRSQEEAREIPMDMVMEILTRLPSKSLMRFKCVSKLLSSLISSQYFINRFNAVPSHPRLYMCLVNLKNYRKSKLLSLALAETSTSHMSSFVVDHGLTIPRMGGYIVQNLGGFMVYVFSGKLRIYNPATRKLVTLPAIKSDLNPQGKQLASLVCYYFGHDPVKNQFKVLCSIGKAMEEIKTLSEHWVFDLKDVVVGGGGSWRKKMTQNLIDFCPHFSVKRTVSVNGFIYYLAWDMFNPLVVSFEIGSEEFRMIPLPRKNGDRLAKLVKNVCLIEYDGKVTLLDQTNLRDKGKVDLWVLEDVRNKEWSMKSLVLKPSQLHLVNNITLNLKGTTQNGKVLFKPCDLISPFHILCYDLQNNDMRKIEIKGIPDHWFSKTDKIFDLMFMDHSESIMYL